MCLYVHRVDKRHHLVGLRASGALHHIHHDPGLGIYRRGLEVLIEHRARDEVCHVGVERYDRRTAGEQVGLVVLRDEEETEDFSLAQRVHRIGIGVAFFGQAHQLHAVQIAAHAPGHGGVVIVHYSGRCLNRQSLFEFGGEKCEQQQRQHNYGIPVQRPGGQLYQGAPHYG